MKTSQASSLLTALLAALVGVPVNSSAVPVALQQATATFSQVNPSAGWDFGVGKAINGTTADNLGWAIAEIGLANFPAQTAVFETVTNAGFAGGSRLTFTMLQAHDFDFVYHTLGRFRISVTTDDRSQFADGLAIGGDVSANWTVLNPDTLVSSNGATLTKLGDLSVLASGTSPYQDIYTISATTPLTGITGIRIEALNDPSLPFGGPGRQPLNGNFVLSELLVSVSPVATQDCLPSIPDLVSWWRGETSGSDSMGVHHGTVPYGIAYGSGESGQAFDFDGSTRRVSVADDVAFQLTNAMTLEAWVYPRAYGGFITFRGDNRGGLDTWVLDTYQSGFVNFQIDDAANNYQSVRAPIALNQWQHVAATWDRASGDMKIYLNGALIQQTNTSIIPIGVLDSSQEPAIGIGNHGGTFHQFPFNGLIDEVGIFNRALSVTEIQAIYTVGSAGKCAVTNTYTGGCIAPPLGLAGWWRGEGSASDSAGTNNGILVGGTAFGLGGVGQEFKFDGVDDSVRIPVNGPLTPLDVGIGGGFTIEGWVNPTRLTIGPIAEWNDGAGGLGAHFWHSIDTIVTGDGPGNLYGNIVDTAGVSHSIVSPSGLVSTNTFNHVALTYDKTTGIAVIYHNRVAVKTQNLGIFTPQTSYDLHFGRRASGPFSDSFFKGSMDEMSLYNRALTAAEIESIALATYNGKCAVTNPPVVNCVPAPTGMVSWWQADGNSSDSVGGNNGTSFNGGTFTPGKVGQSFGFNGTNSYVNIPSNVAVKPTGSFTFEAWINYSGNPGAVSSYCIAAKGIDAEDAMDWALTVSANNRLRPHVNVNGSWHYFDCSTPLSAGNWYHVALIYDGAHLQGYVNGSLDGSANVTGSVQTSDAPLRIGAYAPVNGTASKAFFTGSIDEAAFYDRNLNQNEIQAIYNSGSAGKCPLPPPPLITEHPQDRTVNAGATAQFSVAATGSPTLRYQWFFAGNAIGGATNTSLAIANAQPVHQGIYHVTVSNDFGFAISSNATLTVLTFPPVITRQPTNVTVIVGSTTNLSVQATGSVTLAYQWLSNGIPMAGRTGTTLSFQNIQFSSAGKYSVIVTNPYGAVTSSVAVLTVNPIPTCVAVHDGLVSWWKGENNAIDNWDSNNGNNQFVNTTTLGKVGRAFSGPFITVNDAPSLRVTNGLTLEAWVNPSTLSSVRVLVSKFDYPLFQPGVSQSAYLLGTTNNGALFFTLTPNGSVRTNTTLVTTNLIPLNQWTHVAATYDGSVMRLYVNGTQIGQTNYSGKIFPGSVPLGIGGFAGPSFPTSSPWQYSGLMDEVSLYNRALSAAEIQSIVAADLTGKCFAPPVITQQPQDQIVPLGEDVKFTVGVSGSRPLTYQWYLNGFGPQYRVPSATNATLIIEKVRTNNVGTYFVTVSNSVGSDFSVRVQLSTLPAPSCVDVLPGLISWWPADGNFSDAMGLNNAASYLPGTYPTGKVGTAFTFNGINGRVSINNTTLNFTNNQNFSIEMWIKATITNSTYANVPLLEKFDGLRGYSLSLFNGRLAFALGGQTASGATSSRLFASSGADLRDAFFHHVAVTIDRTNSNGGVLYVDGAPVLVFDPRTYTNSLLNQLPLYIGGPFTTTTNSNFSGLIDEPAIYNRALTAAEILSIRTAGAAGRCKAKPIIVTQPANTNGVAGQNIALSVQATGTPLLRYQWRRTNQSIAGATNATYNITNLSTANIGTYSVIISNAFGTVTSSNAVVAFANIPPIAYPGVVSGFEDSQIQIAMQGNDPDNKQPNQGLSFFITSGPTNGVLVGTTNSFLRTYTPNPNFFGADTFTFVANDGIASSSNATFTITVRPVNDAPTAQSQIVATDEDTSIAITLQASDIDGDTLNYHVTPPSRGTLSGVAPNLIYTPETKYFGEDLFTFTVTDASNVVSQIAAVGITVRPINDAPVAKIVIAPLDELPGVTNTVLIAPACCDATLLLDGSQSTDLENDALTYIWLDGTNVIATAATVTNRFRPGTHNITLVVSDGITADMETIIVEIITPSEAVDFLKSLVEDSITERRLRSPLVAWLRGAEESFERCHVELGVRFLEMFQQRVRDRISPKEAELVGQLVDTAQAIIDAAPDCEPCHRLGRKGKRGHHDHDDYGRDRDERRDASEVRGGRSSPR